MSKAQVAGAAAEERGAQLEPVGPSLRVETFGEKEPLKEQP